VFSQWQITDRLLRWYMNMPELKLSNIRALIIDMDGVLWRGNDPIGDLPSIFNQFNDRGWKIVLATNNATRTIEQYVQRMQSFGVELQPWQIVNSAVTAAHYLYLRYPQGGPVYVIGEQGLIQALAEHDFYSSEENALAVVVGMDRGLTYEKLRRATLFIREGVPFIATNPDRTFPTPEGLIPGAGSILAALEAASYVQPIITGKPAPEMYLIAMERLGTTTKETLVIGDRPETDIAGAQALGCRTALVLSGVVTLEEAHMWQPEPDIIIPDLASILMI
jgi:4-nitrophenyl phosphatase